MPAQVASRMIPKPSKTRSGLSWTLRIAAAAAFAAAASAKLSGAQMSIDMFEQIGLGQGFRYVTATVELIGCVGLLAPGLTAFGALLLSLTMVCATMAHLFVLHNNPGGAVLLLIVTATITVLHRDQFTRLTFLGKRS